MGEHRQKADRRPRNSASRSRRRCWRGPIRWSRSRTNFGLGQS